MQVYPYEQGTDGQINASEQETHEAGDGGIGLVAILVIHHPIGGPQDGTHQSQEKTEGRDFQISHLPSSGGDKHQSTQRDEHANVLFGRYALLGKQGEQHQQEDGPKVVDGLRHLRRQQVV